MALSHAHGASVQNRRRSLHLLDSLVDTLRKSPAAALGLFDTMDDLRVGLTIETHASLKAAFSREHETAFLLFADMESGVIRRAISDETQRQGKGSFGFQWDFVRQTTQTIAAEGLELVGYYHSHTGPSRSTADSYPRYDHSMLSPDDFMIFPHVIPGTSFADREGDPGYESIANKIQLSLLGAVKDGTFLVRAYIPLSGYGLFGCGWRKELMDAKGLPKTVAGRMVDAPLARNFIALLESGSARPYLVDHYRGTDEFPMLEIAVEINGS